MGRSARRDLSFGLSCIGFLTLTQIFGGSSSYDRKIGYVPRDIHQVSLWSDSRLNRELFLISDNPGDCRGDANYTLPQRDAYSTICAEISKRRID